MSTTDMSGGVAQSPPVDLTKRVDRLMPSLVGGLKHFVGIPSIASPGFPPEPLFDAHNFVVEQLRDAGVTSIASLRFEGKTAPVVFGEIPAPPGAPTVLLYSHYDVVPAGDRALWHTPPFGAVERDGSIYGRGAADSKANVMGIVGALRCYDGRPPVGIKVIIEGQEEVGSPFDTYPPKAPDMFASDAMIIADVGSIRPGVPTLTVALRGSAQIDLEIRTLAGDKHSGQYGGAAPDARIAMIHLLASIHDRHGDVAVPGLIREPWTGSTYSEDEFRRLAEVEPGVPLMGSGDLGQRIWSGPAVTVVAFEAPKVDEPINAVAAHAHASLNLRVHPEQDAGAAAAALARFLQSQRPFGVTVDVSVGETGNGVAVSHDGPAFQAAFAALRMAWGAEPVLMAGGGSIPLVMALHQAVPAAEKLLFGVTDSYANIHAPNERVLLDEFEKGVVAMAAFFAELANRWEPA